MSKAIEADKPMSFEEWYLEDFENYGFRYERANEMIGPDDTVALERWLQAAYEVGARSYHAVKEITPEASTAAGLGRKQRQRKSVKRVMQ